MILRVRIICLIQFSILVRIGIISSTEYPSHELIL